MKPTEAPFGILIGPLNFGRRVSASLVMLVLLPSLTPDVARAQYSWTTNNGTIIILQYVGPGGGVVVPSTITGLPVTAIGAHAFALSSLTSVTVPDGVTSIGDSAFYQSVNLTNITLPNSVTRIEPNAFSLCPSLISVNLPEHVTTLNGGLFWDCTHLASVAIPASVTNIGGGAFSSCISLTYIAIPNSVVSVGSLAFYFCTNLTNVTIGDRVTTIGSYAFDGCTSLRGAYFAGDAVSVDSGLFAGANNATVYYLPGTTGWNTTFGGRPTALWSLANPLILNQGPGFGVQSNGFGFVISWATNLPVVVETAADLTNPNWVPLATNIIAGGSSYFSDALWTNYPARFYRVRSP